MSQAIKVGLVGLDTSHVPAFTRILNDVSYEHHIPGAQVVAGYPGAVDDFEPSYSRVDRFTAEIRDEHGVEILDSPEAVAERVDLVLITSVDGRAHRGFMERVAPAGKPVYLDKPLACSLADAAAILELGRRHGVAVMSCSNVRYADLLQAALQRDRAGITSVQTFGAMVVHEQQPGFYWYGVHQVEMAVAALGPGAEQVQVDTSTYHDVATVRWADGRVAVLHGQRESHRGFGITLHRAEGVEMLDLSKVKRPNYAMMLERVLQTLPKGESDIPAEETMTVMAIIEAANESRANGGRVVEVQPTGALLA